MNRTFKIFSLLAVLTMAFASVSPAFAQEGTPPPPQPGSGPLSEYVVAAFAASSGLSVEEIQARMANGETIGQIAKSLELDKSVVANSVKTAITEGLNAGVITQEQADKIARRQENHPPAPGGPPGSNGGEMLEKLGLTREELQAKLDSGMTMAEILAAAGLPTPRPDNPALLKRLGLTKEELQAKLDSGMTIEQIKAEAGIPPRPGDGQRPPKHGDGQPSAPGDGQQPPTPENGKPPKPGDGQQHPKRGDGQPPKPGEGTNPPPPSGDGSNPTPPPPDGGNPPPPPAP